MPAPHITLPLLALQLRPESIVACFARASVRTCRAKRGTKVRTQDASSYSRRIEMGCSVTSASWNEPAIGSTSRQHLAK